MKKLRVGLVGTGFIAPFHLDGFSSCAEAEIVGICAHSAHDRLRALCAERALRPYAGFREMASDPGIEALILGSYNPDHFGQILLALELGKPVLVEKPVVTSLEHYDVLLERSARLGVPVMPAHNFLYRGAVREALRTVRSGVLGRIIFGSFASNHTISAEHASGWRAKLALSSGGALMDSGHHPVYQALAFLGRPERLHAFTSRRVLVQMEGEDAAHVQLLYPDGTLGSILQTWTNNRGGAVDGIRLVGTQGSLEVTDALYVNGQKGNPDVDYARSFHHQAQAFVDCVTRGVAPLSTLRDARDTLELILHAYESAAGKGAITL